MSFKIALAALATGLLVASCGDDDSGGGGGGGTTGLPEKVASFVSTCQSSMEQQMSKMPAGIEDSDKAEIVKAAKGMCACVGKEINESKDISDGDKEKVWAMKEFSPRAKPEISDASKKAFAEVGKKCAGPMMAVMTKIMSKMKNK